MRGTWCHAGNVLDELVGNHWVQEVAGGQAHWMSGKVILGGGEICIEISRMRKSQSQKEHRKESHGQKRCQAWRHLVEMGLACSENRQCPRPWASSLANMEELMEVPVGRGKAREFSSEYSGGEVNTKFGVEYFIFLKRDFTVFIIFSKTPARPLPHTLIMHNIEGKSPSPSNTYSLDSHAVYSSRRQRTTQGKKYKQ